MGKIRQQDWYASHCEREGLYFHLLTTADGSFTATSSSSAIMDQESMHSSQGAFSESEYIYGEAIEFCLQHLPAPVFINVGLGIGYNEMSLFVRLARQAERGSQLSWFSYEIYPELTAAFVDFLFERKPHPLLHKAYENMLEHYSRSFAVEKTQILMAGRQFLESGRWQLRGDILTDPQPPRAVNAILFDAYSKTSSAPLWTPSFLDQLLSGAADSCLFTTYAATGDLNRALKRHSFHLNSRPGFAFKRQSTWASRGFAPHEPSALLP